MYIHSILDIIYKDDNDEDESSDESELRRLQQQYNEEEKKENEDDDEKATITSELNGVQNNIDNNNNAQFLDEPSTDLNAGLSLEANPSNTNKYQHQLSMHQDESEQLSIADNPSNVKPNNNYLGSGAANNDTNHYSNDTSYSPLAITSSSNKFIITDDYTPHNPQSDNNGQSQIQTRNPANSTFQAYNTSNMNDAPAFAGNIDKVDTTEYDPSNSNAKAFGVDIFQNENKVEHKDNEPQSNNIHIHQPQPQKKEGIMPYVASTTKATATTQNNNKSNIKPIDKPIRKYSMPPNKPIPAAPSKDLPKVYVTNDSSISRNQKKWVNFIAKVKSHQTKQIWRIYNYNEKGYEENASLIMNKLESKDKNEEHGILIIDNNKLFVFIRNLNCKFPYNYCLRMNNDNKEDSMKLLQQIVKNTNDSIQQLNIHDIATFDYNLHFDNTVNKLRTPQIYTPSFYVQ